MSRWQLLFAILLLLLAAGLTLALDEERLPRASVLAEPLACGEQAGLLVCVDPQPGEDLACQLMDSGLLYCRGETGAPR
ncbi:MAG: hypothetical protein JXR96_22630 [Deltaproteobacteria bacterium]|nr:hypothetical protein [Deltaproteobacteria bacterium]